MSRSPEIDPAHAVSQPVGRALDLLIVGAIVSFALSIATALVAVLTPDGPLHEVAHFALVGAMAVVVLARGVHVFRRRDTIREDAWTRAKTFHGSDARLAQILTVAVPLAWLFGGVTILVQHVPALHGAALMLGAWLPVAAALWILASFAWHDFCSDRIAAALDESDRRYRDYWRDLARPS